MEDAKQESIMACYKLESTRKLKVRRCNELSVYVRRAPKGFCSTEGDLSHGQEQEKELQDAGDPKRRKQNMEIQKLDETGDVSEATLTDVHLTIEPSSQPENVPLISLTCKSYDKAIVGYPVEVTDLNNGSDTLIPCKRSLASKEKSTSFHQLSWKTSRRTPVCYIANSLSCPDSKKRATEEAGVQNTMMMPKNAGDFKGGKVDAGKTCVPVELIFSRILSGLC